MRRSDRPSVLASFAALPLSQLAHAMRSAADITEAVAVLPPLPAGDAA